MGEDSKEIRITYETLYELLRREKSKEELQKLDESFFSDVLDYLREKTKIVKEAAGKFDMFSVEERENTQIQLSNVKKILKELYERREKKIIDMALNKSKTNSNIIDTTNLLSKEHELYNNAVKLLDDFRKDVLFSLLELKYPGTFHSPEAASVDEKPAQKKEPAPVENAKEQDAASSEQKKEESSAENSAEKVSSPEAGAAAASDPAQSRIKVKFLQKVEQFVGKELEIYGPFEPGTTAELPKEIADILVNKGSASIVD